MQLSSKENVPKRPYIVCNDCISEKNIKAKLQCGHTICRSCLVRELMERFCIETYYNYTVFCKRCSAISEISILFFMI